MTVAVARLDRIDVRPVVTVGRASPRREAARRAGRVGGSSGARGTPTAKLAVDGRPRRRRRRAGSSCRRRGRPGSRPRPVDVDPDADDGARVGAAEAGGLAENAGELADPDVCERSGPPPTVGARRRGRSATSAGSAPGASAGRLLGGLGHRQRDDRGELPGPVGRQPRSAGSRARQSRVVPAAPARCDPRGHGPPLCSSADARQTSGVPVGEPARDDVVRGADEREVLPSREETPLASRPPRRGRRASVAAEAPRRRSRRRPVARARTPVEAAQRGSPRRPRR